MKYLITGLGNIGSEYLGTRHNIGFRVVNALVEDAGVPFTEERYGAIARMRIKNCELIILKPNTFMNLSGNAVRYWLQKENIPVENLLVIVDDLALPFVSVSAVISLVEDRSTMCLASSHRKSSRKCRKR